jgi:hypothetical protein
MSRALFCVLPQPGALPKLTGELHRIGITNHNLSTVRFDGPAQEPQPSESPGGRQIHATGQLRWAILGASSTGATRRIARALAGMGMSESVARHYQELVRAGSTLLCVFCETASEARQAVMILRQSGVKELAATGASGSR